MSVALIIEQIDGIESGKYVPVAVQSVYDTYWMPLCENRNLKNLELISTGSSFTEQDIDVLIGELNVFRSALFSAGFPKDTLAYVDERSALLISELGHLKNHTARFFIG